MTRRRELTLWGHKDTLDGDFPIRLTHGTEAHCRAEAATYRRAGWYTATYPRDQTPIMLALINGAGQDRILRVLRSTPHTESTR